MDDRSWYDVIGKFKDKASEFSSAYQQIKNSSAIVANNPTLKAENARLLKIGATIAEKIQNITGAVDKSYDWLKTSLGFDAVNDQLGVLPAIPIAVAVAAVAAMTKFLTDAYIYLDKVEKFEQLQKQVGPDKAASIIAKLDERTSIMGSMFKGVAPILLIAGIWFYFRGK